MTVSAARASGSAAVGRPTKTDAEGTRRGSAVEPASTRAVAGRYAEQKGLFYAITAAEDLGGGFITAPPVGTAVNPETVYFKWTPPPQQRGPATAGPPLFHARQSLRDHSQDSPAPKATTRRPLPLREQ
jgi:hypothetical protein